MSNVYSLSIDGIHNAEVALEQAARKIAAGRGEERQSPRPEDTVNISLEGGRAAAPPSVSTVDYASEIMAIKESEIALKANFKSFAVQQKLDREILDLYA
jgi:hypothetical protein